MSAAVKCETCQDTGSLPGSHDLDCASCGAAVERVVFEAELPRVNRTQWMRDQLWSAYVMGKAAGAAQAVPDGWQAVPMQPTEAMITSKPKSAGIQGQSCQSMQRNADISKYLAMLRAAPKAP